MKPEELMIGDYVYNYYKNDIIKIRDIVTKETMYSAKQYINGDLLDGGSAYCARVEKISPIPITPEILEKNGFEMKIADYTPNWKMYILNPNFFLEDRLKGFYHFNGNKLAKINYVHELQHALRLCKIDKEIKL